MAVICRQAIMKPTASQPQTTANYPSKACTFFGNPLRMMR